jgi:hypothetical protein
MQNRAHAILVREKRFEAGGNVGIALQPFPAVGISAGIDGAQVGGDGLVVAVVLCGRGIVWRIHVGYNPLRERGLRQTNPFAVCFQSCTALSFSRIRLSKQAFFCLRRRFSVGGWALGIQHWLRTDA